MKKSKILFLVQLPPPVHGASSINKLLAESQILKNKYQIDILPIQIANKMEGLGNFSMAKLFGAIAIYFKLWLKLLSKKYDLVYFTLSPLGFAFYKDVGLVYLLKLFNRKIIFHLHGKGIKNELKSNFKKKLYASVFKNVHVIQLAEVLYDDIKDVYLNQPYLLPNGIKKIKIDSLQEANQITTFIYLSNLMEEKGILIFLEAVKNLKEFDNKFKVHIVGPSSDVTIEQLEEYINQN